MPTTEPTALLTASGGQIPSLRHVGARGRVAGPLMSMTVRQSYRNETADTLETVYTFPLAWGAVLTGLAVEIAGRRLTGAVLPRQEAEARYEEAVAEGDAPILVRRSSDQLHTVELGSLRPGEEAVIEIRYAQLLRIEQGWVRLSVPTTIAPRYGEPAAGAGLAVHDAVAASAVAAYPFDLEIVVDGALAAGAIDSPTHAIEVRRDDGSTLVRLARTGWLDRDVVIAIDAAPVAAPAAATPGSAHALRAPDGDGSVALASFCPALGDGARGALALKILVDCSGSMAGDSIEAARRAIGRVLAELRPDDRFAYSRFGSKTVHAFGGLRRAEPVALARARAALAETAADLGGTEMQAALEATFSLGESEPADVLLVTDGDVWAIDAIVAAARASGQRVFAVGVGSAPAESLLRQLAESTGGACELVAPNERIEAAIARMLVRIRMPRARDVRIDWGATPAWSTLPPVTLFDGDTLHVFAGFGPDAGAIAPRLSCTLDGSGGARSRTLEAGVAQAAPGSGASNGDDADADASLAALLPRLAAWHRIDELVRRDGMRDEVPAWARELALRHRLVTAHTHLFLVHRRAQVDKATDLPTLQSIDPMLAAGWGGTGSVRDARALRATRPGVPLHDPLPADLDRPSVWRMARSVTPSVLAALDERSADPLVVPRFLHRTADATPAPALPARGSQRSTPRRLLATLRSRLVAPSEFQMVVRTLDRAALPDDVADALRALAALGLSRDEAWLLIVAWLASRVGDAALPGPDAMRAIDALLAALPAAARDEGLRIVAARMGTATLEAW
jgi:Ca-activated chloride channel family protein